MVDFTILVMAAFALLLMLFIYRRIQDKKHEDFEDRDN